MCSGFQVLAELNCFPPNLVYQLGFLPNQKRFAKGEKIDSMILSYDKKIRKINLSIKDKEDHEEKEALSQYGSKDSGASLGDILGEALNNKNSA